MTDAYSTLSAFFTDIADSIREKTGETTTIVADNFSNAIMDSLSASPREYLTFSSANSFTIRTLLDFKTWDGTILYSTNKTTWIEWNGKEITAGDNGTEYVLYFIGRKNTKITGDYLDSARWVLTGSMISCYGNIESLLDYEAVESGGHPAMADYCYGGMFCACSSLTQAPALPATTLTNKCYNRMFQGCLSLTQAPALPATTLADYCYDDMFYNCSSLTQAPALPATTLADYCYYGMFSGCTGLTQAPALPATTLANRCYSSMFSACSSLTQAPALPTTTLADYCYDGMFYNCSSLTQAPALPATTLANYCYSRMFYNCSSLTQAPALPATTLAIGCYYEMFNSCRSLTQAPALPATTLAINCYYNMFCGCTKIKVSKTNTEEYTVGYRIPMSGTGTTAMNACLSMFYNTGGTFKGTPSINTTYYLSNTNTVVAVVALITFTIDTTSYQAEEGMTVGEWLGSGYNTRGYSVLYNARAQLVSNDSIIPVNAFYFSTSQQGGGGSAN